MSSASKLALQPLITPITERFSTIIGFLNNFFYIIQFVSEIQTSPLGIMQLLLLWPSTCTREEDEFDVWSFLNRRLFCGVSFRVRCPRTRAAVVPASTWRCVGRRPPVCTADSLNLRTNRHTDQQPGNFFFFYKPFECAATTIWTFLCLLCTLRPELLSRFG